MVCDFVSIHHTHQPGQTYNLIISTTAVVCPSRLLHDPSRHGLEIHQVVALLQDRHPLDPLLSLCLIWVVLLLLLLDSTHIDISQMLRLVKELVERVRRVDRLIGLGCVLAGILEDDLRSTRVLGQELCHIVCLAVYNDPA